MATPVDFTGMNRKFTAPPGKEGEVGTLPAFNNGQCTVSCWQFTPEEIAEVVASGGRVFLSVWFGKTLPPVYVGSEEAVRAVVADLGEVWRK